MSGYAVVDVETTGLHPGKRHRIIEVAVVDLDRSGDVIGEWCSLVNPERDLGAQHVHGISAAEVRRAPTFAEIAGDLVQRLAGKLMVAHNLSFDTRFLAAEYARLGVDAPIGAVPGLCTMRLSTRYLAGSARSLAACCRAADVAQGEAHSALDDARAAAGLMAHYLRTAGMPEPWRHLLDEAARVCWPTSPTATGRMLRRGEAVAQDSHFLARLINRLPHVMEPVCADEYLAVLDAALLDRHLSESEKDELVDVARALGLGRSDVLALHRGYLFALAQHAWADGVVTESEYEDLRRVAILLGLDDELDDVLAAPPRNEPATAGKVNGSEVGRFRLKPGDVVVFTGQTRLPRETWERRAREAGLAANGYSVTKKTRLVVAADPDSLSGKAKKARQYGIPIVTEEAFEKMLDEMCR